MAEILEIVLQFVLEVLLQTLGQAMGEFGFHSMREAFKRRPNPWVAGFGYFIWGAIVGGISLKFVPALITDAPARIAHLAFAPILAGATMSALGAWRARRDQQFVPLHRFAYGYLFAVSMALVRFYWAK